MPIYPALYTLQAGLPPVYDALLYYFLIISLTACN